MSVSYTHLLEECIADVDCKLSEIEEEHSEKKADLERTELCLKDREHDFLNGQAANLAHRLLKPGEPCPVCGSKSHPRPANSGLFGISAEEMEEQMCIRDRCKAKQFSFCINQAYRAIEDIRLGKDEEVRKTTGQR